MSSPFFCLFKIPQRGESLWALCIISPSLLFSGQQTPLVSRMPCSPAFCSSLNQGHKMPSEGQIRRYKHEPSPLFSLQINLAFGSFLPRFLGWRIKLDPFSIGGFGVPLPISGRVLDASPWSTLTMLTICVPKDLICLPQSPVIYGGVAWIFGGSNINIFKVFIG